MRSALLSHSPAARWRADRAPSALAALLCACLLAAACQRATPAAEGSAAEPKPAAAGSARETAGEGVTLTAEEVSKLGIESTPVTATEYTEEAAGFGVVLGHDTIAQAVLELATARAAVRLSHSSLERAQKLKGTEGAVSADALEAAAQKAAVDEAALAFATRKLSATLGMSPPWKSDDSDGTLRSLASGSVKLVRATFPLGAGVSGTPKHLRAAALGVPEPGAGFALRTVWDAPADAAVPGRSYFALLAEPGIGEGERLEVFAPIGKPVAGFLIPESAALINEGKYWCYLEAKPGVYSRIGIDTSRPAAGGYFVSEGVTAGAKVVTAAAGLLLAKETGSSAEPE